MSTDRSDEKKERTASFSLPASIQPAFEKASLSLLGGQRELIENAVRYYCPLPRDVVSTDHGSVSIRRRVDIMLYNQIGYLHIRRKRNNRSPHRKTYLWVEAIRRYLVAEHASLGLSKEDVQELRHDDMVLEPTVRDILALEDIIHDDEENGPDYVAINLIGDAIFNTQNITSGLLLRRARRYRDKRAKDGDSCSCESDIQACIKWFVDKYEVYKEKFTTEGCTIDDSVDVD